MKFKKLLRLGVAAFFVYSVGRVTGHRECLESVVKQRGDCLFKDKDTFTVPIGKRSYITVTKPAEKETEECNA